MDSRRHSRKFPPIASHGVIGDRRTGALVAADGSIDWSCAPDFDGTPIFGSLLDQELGGYCRLHPVDAGFGQQSYLKDTAVLVTRWDSGAEVVDVMGWPMDARESGQSRQRLIIRRLTAQSVETFCLEVHLQEKFAELPELTLPAEQGAVLSFRSGIVTLWASFPVAVLHNCAFAEVALNGGDEHWVVIGWEICQTEWSTARATQTFENASEYWRRWSSNLKVGLGGGRAHALRRSALTVQLLSHAEHARLGKAAEVENYLVWLCGLHSSTAAPLQVCYRLNGDVTLDQKSIEGPGAYEGSLPVRRGNRAAKQVQLGSMGFFAHCASIYLENGGKWREEFWEMLKRDANFSCANWQTKDSGIWELPQEAHYTASRVMSWVILIKAVQIGSKTGHAAETGIWSETADRIHADVMEHGWSEEKQSFRQRYQSEAIDAAALLIPPMDFLPLDHPRVAATLKAIERELVIDGLVHRFVPADTLGGEQLPIGKFEGAFLPCVFWHASRARKDGQIRGAQCNSEQMRADRGWAGNVR